MKIYILLLIFNFFIKNFSLHENPELQISVRYAFLINYMYTMAFYTPILPIVLVWTLLGLGLTFIADKVK